MEFPELAKPVLSWGGFDLRPSLLVRMAKLCVIATLTSCSDRVLDRAEDGTAASSPSPAAAQSLSESDFKYRIGTPLTFGTGGNGETFKGEGWSGPEEGHTWSNATTATIVLPIDRVATPLKLRMFMSGFRKDPELRVQPVEVMANGRNIIDWQVGEAAEYSATIPLDLIKDQNVLSIELNIPRAASPKKLGIGTDDRTLGVALGRLQVDPSS